MSLLGGFSSMLNIKIYENYSRTNANYLYVRFKNLQRHCQETLTRRGVYVLLTIVMPCNESYVSVHCVVDMSTECKVDPQDCEAVTTSLPQSLYHTQHRCEVTTCSKDQ